MNPAPSINSVLNKERRGGVKNKCKIGILSLGCPRNLVDSEAILGRLRLKGHLLVEMDKAEVAIVNTCCFIDDAKRESIDAILDLVNLKKEGRLKKIIVAGCLAQRYKESLIKELPEIDAFVGRISLDSSAGRLAITPKYYGYLKICESCVNNCSYCVIPGIKGKFTSLDMDSIIAKVKMFNKDGISELNIIGQDITGFGIDLYGGRKLPKVLQKIVGHAGNIKWIRLLYLYPGPIINKILDVMKDNPQICRYIDLPIQHINNRILKLMNRKNSKDDIVRIIENIRKKLPDAAIRTSLIVGFPSETEHEFDQLLKFIEWAKFERLGAFIYSREEGTPAYDFKNQVPEKVKLERFNRLMLSQKDISEGVNSKFLGRVMDVLIEEKEKDYYLGRSQYDAPEVDGMVYVYPRTNYNLAKSDNAIGAGVNSKLALKPGDFIKVKITDTLEYDLVGEGVRG